MNTPDEWKTTATVTDPERKMFWESVFGTDKVPIKSFFPTRADLPGYPDALVYMLDLRVITPEQRARLVEGLAKRFKLDPAWLDVEIDEQGVPILSDHVNVVSTDAALFFGTVADLEDDDWEYVDWPEPEDE